MVRITYLFICFLFVICSVSQARDIEVYFTPNEKAVYTIGKYIEKAKKNIDVAVYCFTSRKLAWKIVEAKKRGIKIRILIDAHQGDFLENKYTKSLFLKKKGIDVRLSKNYVYKDFEGIMHNKFAIIDRKIVITGSFNWTASAYTRNNENIVILKRVDIANLYEQNFEKLWKKGQPLKFNAESLKIIDAENINEILENAGFFVRIRGKISEVYLSSSKTYFLHFKGNKQFKIVIFKNINLNYDPFSLRGKTVEIWGRIFNTEKYGLEIIIDLPEQIRIL
ncbi:MAG: DUF1669 domain-containing protein [Deltaproteobacteria bacterium]|nr:DUF1669 domain-containing protein [Deltaproteobacteria bacterium]